MDNFIYITYDERFSCKFNGAFVLNLKLLFEQLENNLRSGYETEDFYHKVCEKAKSIIVNNPTIKGIVMDYDLQKYNPFDISAHIRLSNNIQLKKLSIIIASGEEITVKLHYQKFKEDLGLLKLKCSIWLTTYSNLFRKDSFGTPKYKEFLRDFDYDKFLEDFKVELPETTTRHQIANEWGAFKLAYQAGFDISYEMPQTLFFKYLKAKYGAQNKQPKQNRIFQRKIKVLLIDDNADKGWKEALEKLLPADVKTIKNKLQILAKDDKKLAVTIDDFDLIFLDLYFPDYEDAERKNIGNAKKILKKLKEKNAAIPVIVFTASNKVWNLQKLEELGADGYFVKESPENASVSNFSEQNFKLFNEIVKSGYEKGKLLRPYWKAIRYIENNLLEQIRDQIRDQKKQKFKSRILERLKMFLGLLKRGLEQNKFNEKNFYYSDCELSFITLWSILNEVQEAYYQKSFPDEHLILDWEGQQIKEHPNGTPINPIQGYNWQIQGQDDYLIKHEFEIEKYVPESKKYKLKPKSFKCNIIYNKDNPPYFFVECNENYDARNSISSQIAFLILKKNELKDYGKKDDYLKKLKELNKLRNHLYLTHGGSLSSRFFEYTEKEKRKEKVTEIDNNKIEKLFFLVSFVLIGTKIEELETYFTKE